MTRDMGGGGRLKRSDMGLFLKSTRDIHGENK